MVSASLAASRIKSAEALRSKPVDGFDGMLRSVVDPGHGPDEEASPEDMFSSCLIFILLKGSIGDVEASVEEPSVAVEVGAAKDVLPACGCLVAIFSIISLTATGYQFEIAYLM